MGTSAVIANISTVTPISTKIRSMSLLAMYAGREVIGFRRKVKS
jgi:hypothetical protein